MDTSSQNEFINKNQNQTKEESAYSASLYESTPPSSEPFHDENPTIVMPSNENRTQPIFYVIFAITIIAFFGVSYLLYQSFLTKRNASGSSVIVPTLRPSATPIAIIPTETPVPVDTVALGMRTLKNSDLTADIVANINETDYSSISDTLKKIDAKLKTSFP